MIILGIETSTSHSSVSLVDQHGEVAAARLGVGQRHSEFLTPAIRFCLHEADLTLDAVNGVAVGVGPGLYTGLRVGLVTARTIAAARRLPIVGLSGLDVVAFQVRHVRRLICAALDARREELFWAFYRPAPGGVQRATELRVGRPEKLVAEIEGAGEECLVIGEGGVRYADLLDDVGADVAGPETAWPDASDLATLTLPRFVREETQRVDEIQPIYLRVADARLGWETRGRLQGGHVPAAVS